VKQLELTESFLSALPEPAVVVQGDGTIVAANDRFARLVGSGSDVLRGRSIISLIDNPGDSYWRFLRSCSSSTEVTPGAFDLLIPGAEPRHIQCECTLIQPRTETAEALVLQRFKISNEAGSRFALLTEKVKELEDEVHRRIVAEQELLKLKEDLEILVEERTSALSASNEELARSNRSLEEFAFVASHDLQEPLRKISNFGSLLLGPDSDVTPEERRLFLGRIMDSADRMRHLINNLLEFSRVSSREQKFTDVELPEVIGSVLADLESQVEETGATVEVSELPMIEGDRYQLHRLMQNLISNALKYHRPGVPPLVRISSRHDAATEVPGSIAIQVEDNGIGFEEGAQDRIFTIFNRLHSRTEYEGTGIGLAICKKVVERHGGVITATSRLGGGSTFIITLPMKQEYRFAPKGLGE
jgi:signal transduction histidine kinase